MWVSVSDTEDGREPRRMKQASLLLGLRDKPGGRGGAGQAGKAAQRPCQLPRPNACLLGQLAPFPQGTPYTWH